MHEGTIASGFSVVDLGGVRLGAAAAASRAFHLLKSHVPFLEGARGVRCVRQDGWP